MLQTRLSRRTLLAGAAGLGAAPLIGSCSPAGQDQRRSPPPDPDTPIRNRALTSINVLISSYDTTVDRYPSLSKRLEPLLAEHRAHLAALGPPIATGSPSPSAVSSASGPSPVVPADPRRALRALVAAESRAATDRVGEVASAASPDLARLLAGIGASEATHAALLGARAHWAPGSAASQFPRAVGQGQGSRAEAAALQAALAAEHAAIYGYGNAGARLSGAEQQRGRAAYDTHRARRDQLAALIRDRGEEPAAAAPAYDLPFPVGGAAAARRLAVRLEDGVAAAYADVVRAGTGEVRKLAARVLQEVGVLAATWRGVSVPFPGLPERSQPASTPSRSRAGTATPRTR